MVVLAARSGFKDVLGWLKDRGVALHNAPWAAQAAAEGGQLEVLKYLKSENLSLDEKEFRKVAAEGGHLDVVEYLEGEGRQKTGLEGCSPAQAEQMKRIADTQKQIDDILASFQNGALKDIKKQICSNLGGPK